jgi:hypothetical protein
MTMHTLIRAAALTLAVQQAASLAAELAAQGAGGATSNPACALVTEKDVEAATGLDYGPGEHFDELNVTAGKATCVWVVEDLPEIGIDFFPASAGSHTEGRAKWKLRPQCTRESVRGVGERAFVETCEASSSGAGVASRSSASVYARAGRSDIAVVIYMKRGESMASPIKSVAIALAKAAAARAKGK